MVDVIKEANMKTYQKPILEIIIFEVSGTIASSGDYEGVNFEALI